MGMLSGELPLALHSLIAEGSGLLSGQGAEIPYAKQPKKKRKKDRKKQQQKINKPSPAGPAHTWWFVSVGP